MADERDDPLSADERRALDELPDTLDPPAHLESRIASDLYARGLTRKPGPASVGASRWRWLTTAAAVLMAFGGGWAAHAWTMPATTVADTGPRYMLLLYGADTTPEEEPRRVSEYTAWARSMASGGVHVSGEKLEDRAMLLGAAQGAHLDPDDLAGFFIVGARDDEAAEALARTHPHLRYGGRVLIRPITGR